MKTNRTKKLLLAVALLMPLTSTVGAVSLPGQHTVKQNENGDYYVVNKDNVTMIEPAIIKLGFSSRWILACIKNEAIDSELVRWVFVDMRNGGTYDSLNTEQWSFYRDEAYTDLQQIKLTDFRDDACP